MQITSWLVFFRLERERAGARDTDDEEESLAPVDVEREIMVFKELLGG